MGTAVFVKNRNGAGVGKVYRLDPPVTCQVWTWDGYEESVTEYVWVSAVVAFGSGPETYIFPCDKNGLVLSYLEMAGSYRGGLDHELALRNAGYRVSEGGAS